MKYLNWLLIIVCMAIPMSIYAQNYEEQSYLTLAYNATDKALYLIQQEGTQQDEGMPCKQGNSYYLDPVGLTCVESHDIYVNNSNNSVYSLLNEYLNKYWVKKSPDETKYESTKLVLATDIDFKNTEILKDGTLNCKGYNKALEFSGLEFDGGNYSIKGFCLDYDNDKNMMTSPAGLFNRIDGGIVKNLGLDKVLVRVRAEKMQLYGKDIFPVGALAGEIEISTIENIQMGQVQVEGPYVGGLAGYAKNSSISNVSMMKAPEAQQIDVSNAVVLSSDNSDGPMGSFNAVLGGLVGASYSSSFTNISISPVVENKVNVELSALGGLVGYFVYAEDKSIENVSILASGADFPVLVRKGTSMGGLLGATKKAGNVCPKLTIDNVVVNRALIDSAQGFLYANGNQFYMGGMVGKSDLCDGGALKITHSRVTNSEIKETVLASSPTEIYAGGIAGYAGCDNTDNASSSGELFLTLTDSYASGEILLDGGIGVSPDYVGSRVSSAIGGLVGKALFASKDAVNNDTSAVYVAYKVKTINSDGDNYVDTLAVGGAFGVVSSHNYASDVELNVKNVVYKGYSVDADQYLSEKNVENDNGIVVEDDGLVSFVGGIVGRSHRIANSGNGNISFNNISVFLSEVYQPNLISYTNAKNKSTSASIGGVCGFCQFVSSMERISVNGNIEKVSNNQSGTLKNEFFMGGLAGRVSVENKEVLVGNTYSIGNVSFNEELGLQYTGYLFGSVEGTNVIGRANKFISNYHYGSGDNDVNISAIGSYGGENDFPQKLGPGSIAKSNINVISGEVDSYDENKNGSVGIGNFKQLVTMLNDAWEDDDKKIWVPGGDMGNPVFGEAIESPLSSSSSVENSSSSVLASSSSVENSSSSVLASSSSVEISSSSVLASSSSVKNSSSSALVSSSSVENSSSSVLASSSSVKNSSSSALVSSSSKGSSSSSSNYLYEVAEPKVNQNGNSLHFKIDDQELALPKKVDYHIVVTSDVGVYLDTVVDGSVVKSTQNKSWVLNPAPVGDYNVKFTLSDGLDSVSFDRQFSTSKYMSVPSYEWQTISMFAFCGNDSLNCQNTLTDLFANQQKKWAYEECQYMREEIANGHIMDDGFYQQVDEICRMAKEMDDATTSVYWWDESNPVGDYWQYRKFDAEDRFVATRGYWYGPVNTNSIDFSLQTPNMDDEIVWHFENNYSGWNLVANPFGWFVKLPKDKDVVFWRWNPETSDYVKADTLGPYEAVWVHTEKTREYRVPLRAAIVLDGEKKSLNKSAASENWNLRVVLSDDNGKQDSWNELALGEAVSSLAEPPSGMGDRVNLSIVEGGLRLAKSVKLNSDDVEWNLEASASTSREGHLNFEGLEDVWAQGMRVYATVNDETVEVVKDRPVNVQLSSKVKNVSVRVSKSASPVRIAKSLLSGFRVGRGQGVLNVGFDVASGLVGANVKISVVGTDGRIVSTHRAVANEGSNLISIKPPKRGVYFVRLKVGSQTASTRLNVQ